MRIAYADPPYIGQAKKHYSHDPNCAEVDHQELITQLMNYDGWALSLSTPSLEGILHICREVVGENQVRIGSWVKPFASFKPNVNPAFAWEPVIFYGGRKRGRDLPTLRDWLAENITMQKGLAGAKPLKFCFWLFEFLGMEPQDEIIDLFPGTGVVTVAWEIFSNNTDAQIFDLPMFLDGTR